RVAAVIERDPETGVDRLGSVLLDYPGGVQGAFTYGTQHVPRQTMQFLGTETRLEVEVPFNAPNDRPCRLFLYDARDKLGAAVAAEVGLRLRAPYPLFQSDPGPLEQPRLCHGRSPGPEHAC